MQILFYIQMQAATVLSGMWWFCMLQSTATVHRQLCSHVHQRINSESDFQHIYLNCQTTQCLTPFYPTALMAQSAMPPTKGTSLMLSTLWSDELFQVSKTSAHIDRYASSPQPTGSPLGSCQSPPSSRGSEWVDLASVVFASPGQSDRLAKKYTLIIIIWWW